MAADRYTRTCEALKRNGEPCTAKALRDSEPPRCRFHSLTSEELSEQGRKAARTSAAKRRANAEPRACSGLGLGVTMEDVLAVAAEGLRATYADSGLPN